MKNLFLRELETLTANWFYLQSSKKHKRCGSSKIVRELHKREEELGELIIISFVDQVQRFELFDLYDEFVLSKEEEEEEKTR